MKYSDFMAEEYETKVSGYEWLISRTHTLITEDGESVIVSSDIHGFNDVEEVRDFVTIEDNLLEVFNIDDESGRSAKLVSSDVYRPVDGVVITNRGFHISKSSAITPEDRHELTKI